MSYLPNVRGSIKDYSPGIGPHEVGYDSLTIDPSGQLKVRGPTLTDEGGYRANFSNSSLDIAVGSCTFTSGSDIVGLPGTAATSADLHVGDYIYPTSAGSSYAIQIADIDDTVLYLDSPWTLAGGTSPTNRRIIQGKGGVSGTLITVSNGVCILSAGTTNSDVIEIERAADYLPLTKSCRLTFSGAPGANSTAYIGFYDETLNPTKTFAWFEVTGTSTSSVNCKTGWNATGTITTAETETTTVTIPGSILTSANDYQIDLEAGRCTFRINGMTVAVHKRVVPHQHDILTSRIAIVNGTSPSNYTITVDFDECRNYNVVDNSPRDLMDVRVKQTDINTSPTWSPAAGESRTYDCNNYAFISIHNRTAGASNVISPFWSSDGVNWIAAGGLVPVAGGAAVATFNTNAAGIWSTNVVARYFRMTAASASSAASLVVSMFGTPITPANPTVTVSGAVTATMTSTTVTASTAAAGSNLMGDVGLQVRANATGAASLFHRACTTGTNATTAKASAGRVLGWNICTSANAPRYVKFYNSSSAPTSASTVVTTIQVASSATPAQGDLPVGLSFATGIAIAVSPNMPDAWDGTGLAAPDTIVDIYYA